jgi:hypothetical protein
MLRKDFHRCPECTCFAILRGLPRRRPVVVAEGGGVGCATNPANQASTSCFRQSRRRAPGIRTKGGREWGHLDASLRMLLGFRPRIAARSSTTRRRISVTTGRLDESLFCSWAIGVLKHTQRCASEISPPSVYCAEAKR